MDLNSNSHPWPHRYVSLDQPLNLRTVTVLSLVGRLIEIIHVKYLAMSLAHSRRTGNIRYLVVRKHKRKLNQLIDSG